MGNLHTGILCGHTLVVCVYVDEYVWNIVEGCYYWKLHAWTK